MSSDRTPDSIAPLASSMTGNAAASHRKTTTAGLAVGSVGVVYGDIGTSPLYALRESLSRVSTVGTSFETNVISIVSLLLWALIIVVTLKYILFILRCDNRGEGGTLSLMALAQNALGRKSIPIVFIGIIGAALFAGDAIITPAISVLSAVEGLQPYVVAVTCIILVTLFAVQYRGTAGMARWFGPIMCVWFLMLAALGIPHILDAPRILNALNPVWAFSFLANHKLISFLVLGAIFLAVTGTEAIYADMGHFGRKPIQLAWVFFLMAPEAFRLPVVLMATVATVIASQAIITGAFSVARQAIQLGLLPRLEIQHTSATQEGQIYLPTINRLLLIGVLLLVVVFRSSSNLASAYGIAISASMIVDSILAFLVIWKLWRWPLAGAIALTGFFIAVELAFFISNSAKLLVGGYIPAIIGLSIISVMWTWMRGTKLLEGKTYRDSIAIRELIRMLQKSEPTRVPGTAIFLTSDPQLAPAALMHNLKHNKVLHERILIVSVKTEDLPRVSAANRYEVEVLSDDFTAITLRFGFMENPRVPAALVELRKAGIKFDIMTTSFFLGRRTLKTSSNSEMPAWQDKLYVSLASKSANATDFFSIPSDRVVELGAQLTI